MGSNNSRKQVSFQKKLWQAHVSASTANIKRKPLTQLPTKVIRVHELSSPMTLAHSSALAGKPCAGYSKFPTNIYYSAHEIPIAAQSRQGHASSFIKHSYARRLYSAPCYTHPQCPHSPHRRRHSPRWPSPLSPRRSPTLLQPHRSLCYDGDEDVVTSVQTYVRPT
jgi:hypothetical protein